MRKFSYLLFQTLPLPSDEEKAFLAFTNVRSDESLFRLRRLYSRPTMRRTGENGELANGKTRELKFDVRAHLFRPDVVASKKDDTCVPETRRMIGIPARSRELNSGECC